MNTVVFLKLPIDSLQRNSYVSLGAFLLENYLQLKLDTFFRGRYERLG